MKDICHKESNKKYVYTSVYYFKQKEWINIYIFFKIKLRTLRYTIKYVVKQVPFMFVENENLYEF